MVVDLFSGGGGGWCLGARALGLRPVGIEWDGPSCLTRSAAGLLTIRADVAAYPPEVFAGRTEGLCGSPPCQAFSSAGKQRGLADPRGQLVHEPIRWVRAIRPRWVALEQVPEVIGYWRWICRELGELGYSAWCGILNAADYGVPQIRKRAILLASLDRKATPPAPTHSKTGQAEMFGPERLPWVTMAEALGWGLTERPAYTVAAASESGGGHDGGSGARRQIAKAQAAGLWLDRGAITELDTRRDLRSDGSTQTRDFDQPAPSVTGKSGGQWVLRTQTNTGGSRPGDPCPIDRPAPTVLGNSGGRWQLVSPGRSYDAPPRTADPEVEPAPTIALGHNASAWCWERPATTVQCDPHIAKPGHKGDPKKEANGIRQMRDAIRVTIAELGVLQGFPVDHPWQAPERAKQVGNAIPPPLAEACLRSLVA